MTESLKALGARGVHTRRKMKQRGFHHDSDPGFYDVKGAFDRAKPSCKEAQMHGYMRVLRKYALLDDKKDPVDFLAKCFAEHNYGYGPGLKAKKSAGPSDSGEVSWGVSGGMPGETGDANGLSRFLQYGGV